MSLLLIWAGIYTGSVLLHAINEAIKEAGERKLS